MSLTESLYQELKAIRFNQDTGKYLVYPPPVEKVYFIRTRCPECNDILCTDKSDKGHYYYECWNCEWMEYISPERHKRLMQEIDDIPF